MRHKLARREIEKYASENLSFTTNEIQNHLRNKKKPYHLTVYELGNILGKHPCLTRTATRRNYNKVITQWEYEE